MIACNQISLHFGERVLFDDISFLVNPKDRIGLVGKNGAGKTTLLRVLLGEQGIDSGKVEKPSDLSIGYLPQQMRHKNNCNVFEEVKTAFSKIQAFENEIEHLNEKLVKMSDFHSAAYLAIIDRITELHSLVDMLGGQQIEEKIERILFGLGFNASDFNKPTSEFSGGWRMRIELAKILLQEPGLLLLDEPTNHLDIESIQWLEEFLVSYPGAVIVISHDRAFLDNVTSRTIEISLGKAYDYKTNYSKYVILRKERREQQMAAYKNQQKMIEDTEEFIERFRYKATKAVQVQSRIKQLEKLERIEIDEEDTSAIHIAFPPAPRSGDIVITIKELSKSYGEKVVLNKIDLAVKRGERIAFVGKNGEGKTTLSRIIVGELDYSGMLKIGHNVKTGYFAQNQDELLDENLTVFETIDRVAVGDIRTKIRGLLGAFLFRGDDIDKKVKVLSGGERSRLSLIKLLLEPYNLLVLDEPTNHLDMHSKDILKKALQLYTGTLIIVSHDRDFLDGLTTKVLEFKNHRVNEYIGSIYDFLKKRKIETLQELEKKQKAINGETENSKPSANKERFLEKKEFERNLRKLTNKVSECEKEIDSIEKEMALISQRLSIPSADISIHEESVKYNKLKKRLDEKMYEWELLNEEAERFKSSGKS